MESRIIKFINIMTKKERGYLTELYYFALSFFVYGFLGWCTEVAYAAAKQGKFVNRGFLNGPICPVYGIGVGVVVPGVAVYQFYHTCDCDRRDYRIFAGEDLS